MIFDHFLIISGSDLSNFSVFEGLIGGWEMSKILKNHRKLVNWFIIHPQNHWEVCLREAVGLIQNSLKIGKTGGGTPPFGGLPYIYTCLLYTSDAADE